MIETAKVKMHFEYASELYRLSDRRLSAELVLLLQIEGVAWSAQRTSTAVFSDF
jgi:hypothetical protein